MSVENLARAFLQSIGLIAIAAACFDLAWRHIRRETWRNVAIGIVFAWAVVASIAMPVHLARGLFFDLRHTLLVLASLFGGLPAMLIAAGAAAILRWCVGGAGTAAGLAGIGLSGLVGYALARIFKPERLSPPMLAVIGSTSVVSVLGLLALPWDLAVPTLQKIGIPLVLGNFAAVVFAGNLFDQLRRRASREETLASDATTDALTGLTNRRTFDAQARDLIAEATRAGRPCALLLIDIDHFKSINDTFGHEAGDLVLTKIGQALAAQVRQPDLAARFGGEEFAIVLSRADAAGAERAANRLREVVERSRHDLRGITLRVTVSIGICAVTGAEPFDEVFRKADLALYRAKSLGRNRVEMSLAA